MTNREKLDKTLCEIFRTEEDQLPEMAFGSNHWDSIGHVQMIGELEERFDISISSDDIVKMGSYGDILKVLEESYGVKF